MLCVIWFCSLVVFQSHFVAVAELRSSYQKAARDIPLDESEGDLPPLRYGEANAAPQQRWSLQTAVKAAEQDPVAAVADPQSGVSLPDEMTQVVDPTEVEFKVNPQHSMISVATHNRNHPSLIASRRGKVSQTMGSNATAAKAQPAVIEEFDVVENGIQTGIPTSHGRLVDGESQTAEDRRRELIGDYDKVVQPVGATKSLSRYPQSLVRTRAVASQASSYSLAKATKQKPGPEKMKAQCMSFANYLKAQDVQGPELIRMWKGSCDPIVASGNAGASFSTMCQAMGGALEPYVMKANWPPGEVCDEVLRLFNEAGIGVR